jgi:hypothetical protein
MKLRVCLPVAALCLFAACSTTRTNREPTSVQTAQTLYYFAPARITNLDSHVGTLGLTHEENVLLAKTLDPIKSEIIEIACVPSNRVKISPVYMRVSGNTITAISDTPDFNGTKLSGTGTLSGDPWNWNHLTFSMDSAFCPVSHPCPAHVDDANFVVQGSGALDQLVGRKQIYSIPGHIPLELYDLEMNRITQDQYDAYYKQFGCDQP